MRFSWSVEPESTLYLWFSVEERESPESSGIVLSSVGPEEYIPGEPLAVDLGNVPNGDNRYVVVEAREGTGQGLQVLYYGISQAFSMAPGKNVVVDIDMTMNAPETDVHEGLIEIRLDGEVPDKLNAEEAHKVTIHTESVNSVGIIIANDASFSANLTSLDLDSADSVTCTEEEREGVTWSLCDIAEWDLLEGVTDVGDGTYRLFVKFVDRNGYESQVYDAVVVLDSSAPLPITASVSPPVAVGGEAVYLTVTLAENLAEEPSPVLQVLPETTAFAFSGPDRVGASNTYVWHAEIPELEQEDLNVYTFKLTASDDAGNSIEGYELTDEGGAPVEFRIDAVAPQIDGESIVYNADHFGIPGEGVGDPWVLSFDFVINERSPNLPDELGGDGLCLPNDNGCPSVRLAGKPLGAVYRKQEMDPRDGALAFSYEYAIDEADWGPQDALVDVTFIWTDQAGNVLNQTLEQKVRFDLKRPEAFKCNLTPLFANGSSTVTFQMTASEPMEDFPWLFTDTGVDTLFGNAVSDELGVTWQWTQNAAAMPGGDYGLQVNGTDQSGNGSDGFMCEVTGNVDPAAPLLTNEAELEFSSETFGIGDGIPEGENLLSFKMVFTEKNPHQDFEAEEDGTCLAGCPLVLIDGQEVGQVSVLSQPAEGEETWEFEYEYLIEAEEWGAIDQLLDVRIRWADGAQNEADILLDTQVRFDFIRPQALNCTLSPEAANSYDTIKYMLTTTEPLSLAPVLDVDSVNEGLFLGTEPTANPGMQTFAWSQEAGPLDPETYTVAALLEDLAGNLSDGAVCTKSGAVDPVAPALELPLVSGYETTLGIGATNEIVAELDFEFRFAESAPFLLNDQYAECQSLDGGWCPTVHVGNQSVGTLFRAPDLDGEGTLGFHYSYLPTTDDWGDVDKEVEIRIQWADPAGNQADVTLADKVRIDAILPFATDCKLVPEKANANSLIAYSFTVSEDLAENPLLALGEDADLFGGEGGGPEVSGGGQTFTYSGEPSQVTGTSAQVGVTLTDLAGNKSDGVVCQVDVLVDTAVPEVGESPTIWTEPAVVNAEGETILALGHEDLLKVKFTITDDQALAEPEPMVILATAPADLPLQQTAKTAVEGGFEYEYLFTGDKDSQEDNQGNWSIRVQTEDMAGNVTVIESLGEAPIRIDHTPPVAECVLTPPPPEKGYRIGDTFGLQVFPTEEMESQFVPLISQQTTPEVQEALLTYEAGSAFTFSRTVQSDDGEFSATFDVTLRDLVGNESAPGSACMGEESLAVEIDGLAPQVKTVELTPSSGPLKATDLLSVDVEIANGHTEPSVGIGEPPLPLNMDSQQDVEGGVLWTFTRELDGNEGNGGQKVLVEVEDEAGNQASNMGQEPAIDLDFVNPEAYCVVNLDPAKAGDTLRLTVTFSEPLDEDPQLEIDEFDMLLSDDLSLIDSQNPKYVYEYYLDPSLPALDVWGYAVFARDQAGNPVLEGALCEGDAVVDMEPIQIQEGHSVVAAYEDPPDSGNWVETGQVAKEGSVVTITFATDMVPYGEPEITVGEALVESCQVDAESNEYTCTWPVVKNEGEVYESKPVSVRLFDKAGNMTMDTLTMLTLDFAAPMLAGTAFVERCDDYGAARVNQDEMWVPAPAALSCSYGYDSNCDGEDDGISGSVRVSFAITEEVDEEDRTIFLGDDVDTGVELTIEPCASSDNYILAGYTPTGQESEVGCIPIKIAVTDLAGNPATFDVACLRFDFQDPDSPAEDSSLVRLHRNPWGSSDSGGVPEMRVEGCPGPDFCLDEITAAAEEEPLIRLYDTSSLTGEVKCTENLLAEGAGTELGGFMVPFTGDQAVVCVSQVDRAGNEGPKKQTRQVRWVASFNNKVVGDTSENPHELYQALPFDGPRPLLGPETRSVDVQATVANIMSTDEVPAVQSSEDGAWKRVGLSPAGPVGLGGHKLAYVDTTGQVLLFGGHNTGTYNSDLWAWNGWNWTQLCTSDECRAQEPPPRRYHHMWYDPSTDKVILYGGTGEGSLAVSDMWEWDGVAWHEIDQGDLLPPERMDFQAAYDYDRGVIVLFGGLSNEAWQAGDLLEDLWEFDGEAWAEKCTASPCADSAPVGRYQAGMVYDPANSRVLLYGGDDGEGTDGRGRNDLWSWNGTLWSKLCGGAADPCLNAELGVSEDESGLIAPCVTWDSTRDVMVVGCGQNQWHAQKFGVSEHLLSGYLFEWDGSDWTGFKPPISEGECAGYRPCNRREAALAYDPAREELVMFGGWTGASQTDELWVRKDGGWALRCTSDDCLPMHIPYHKKDFGAVFDPVRQETLIFGDGTGGNQMWAWNGESWNIKCNQPSCTSAKPSGRDEPYMMWDEVQSRVLLFGGSGKRDTYAWNGQQWALVHPGNGVAGLLNRLGSCAAFDSVRERLVVYGGAKSGTSCNNIWELDTGGGTGWKLNAPNCSTIDCFPQPRSYTGCAFYPTEESTVFFGGQVVNVTNDLPPDLYAWDGTGWSSWCDDDDCQADAPSASSWTRLAFHGPHEALYQFGGMTNGVRQNGLWKWDGSGDWKELCPYDNCEELRPPGRYGHGFVYDSARERLIAFLGSADADGGDDTWEWTSRGIVPGMIAAFDLGKTQTITRTLTDPQEKVVLAYRPRVRATGIGYDNEDPVAGVRLFASSFGSGPWVPLWEQEGEAAVDTMDQEGGLILDRTWSCSEAQPFEPPEDPGGTGDREYCRNSSIDSMMSGTGQFYLLVSPRAGGASVEHASIALDYVELTVDYFRTGCTATSNDNTACDDGDPDTSNDVCFAGSCIGQL